MQPVEFPGFNTVYGKGQEQYLPLPAYSDPADASGKVTTSWKLSLRERLQVLFRGRVWLQQLTFKNPLQPVRMSVEEP